ncbi:MAG: NADH-quinone oxidoreductase subunit N [Candidatus Eisenbacteria bacterium]|nr:NADH-quinone oxidoreductase subunit N [Candidatus Eisenbacteria bacterium]
MIWQPLLPWLALAGTALLLMLAIAVRRNATAAFLVALAGVAASALLTAAAPDDARLGYLFHFDRFAHFFLVFIALATIAVLLFAKRYLLATGEQCEEFPLLVVLAALGAALLAASAHFVSLFLSLELLSVSLYGLVAYLRRRLCCVEAGFKYLVLAGGSSAFLLFGMALVYARLGTLAFDRLFLIAPLQQGPGFGEPDVIAIAGFGLMLVGFGFKLGVVPFHMWTPDVYQGAPAPVSGFIAAVSKGAVVALLLRFGAALELSPDDLLWQILGLIAAASMVVGNLLALHQTNVKRLLAYSSIAHLGYLLVAFLAGQAAGMDAVVFYMIAYGATILAAFGVVGAMSEGSARAGDAEEIDDYRGLARRRPWLSAAFTLAMLSLAGIPLTVGFIAKFLVIGAGIGAAAWALVIFLAVNSGIGIYYYLRVVVALYLRTEESPTRETVADEEGRQTLEAASRHASPPPARISLPAVVALVVLCAAMFVLGVFPQLVLRLIALPSGSVPGS